MRRGFLVPSKWRMPECRRINFPVAVFLKRLAAPRCVFNFIFLFFFTISSFYLSSNALSGAGTFACPESRRACAQLFSAQLEKFAVKHASSTALRLSACRSRTDRRRGGARAFFRGEQGQQNIRFHARPEFHLRVVGDVHQQTIHLGAAHILVRHFAAAMKNHRLHFVTVTQEPNDLILSHLIIVLGGRRTELHFLDVRTLLVLLRLVRLLALLVQELSVIHQLANRRHGIGRDLDNVQSGLSRCFHCIEQGHHPQLIPCIVNHANFASADALVHSKTTTAFCWYKSTSGARKTSFDAPILCLSSTEILSGRDRARSIARTPSPPASTLLDAKIEERSLDSGSRLHFAKEAKPREPPLGMTAVKPNRPGSRRMLAARQREPATWDFSFQSTTLSSRGPSA